MKELVGATPPPALQAKTRLGQTPLYLAAYWVRASVICRDRSPAPLWVCINGLVVLSRSPWTANRRPEETFDSTWFGLSRWRF